MLRALALAGAATLALSGTALASTGQQISVNGTGGAPVPAGATSGQQQAAYSQALTAAISDAQTKAPAVAQQLSLTLGSVQGFTEQTDDYLGYCGVGFLPGVATGVSGSASAPTAAGTTAGQLRPIPAKHKKRKTKKRGHKAQSSVSESTCQIQADVTVVYLAS